MMKTNGKKRFSNFETMKLLIKQPVAGRVWTQLMREHGSDSYGYQSVKQVPHDVENQLQKQLSSVETMKLLINRQAQAQYGRNSCGSMEATHTAI